MAEFDNFTLKYETMLVLMQRDEELRFGTERSLEDRYGHRHV
jgi:hypothetical protein